ncbi:hypothetical protein L7F22_009999 [Adiantum nelumboides]|nr:hypothetical protein [Adiantum nelumboides]
MSLPWNGGCLAVPLSSRRVHSSLRFRTWPLVQSSSQDSPAVPGCELRWLCVGDGCKQAGSTFGQECHLALRKDFVSCTDVENAAAQQGLSLHLETVGPFFRIRVINSLSKEVLGTAQGLVKLWTCGRILHLDSVRLNPASLKAKKPIFGIAFLLGAAAICHGYLKKCVKAELLAIKDTDTYHSKVKPSFQMLVHSRFL